MLFVACSIRNSISFHQSCLKQVFTGDLRVQLSTCSQIDRKPFNTASLSKSPWKRTARVQFNENLKKAKDRSFSQILPVLLKSPESGEIDATPLRLEAERKISQAKKRKPKVQPRWLLGRRSPRLEQHKSITSGNGEVARRTQPATDGTSNIWIFKKFPHKTPSEKEPINDKTTNGMEEKNPNEVKEGREVVEERKEDNMPKEAEERRKDVVKRRDEKQNRTSPGLHHSSPTPSAR